MTLASRSDCFDGTIVDNNSSTEDCRDVTKFSLGLGHLNEVRLNNDDETFVELYGRQNNGFTQNHVENSPNTRIGDEVIFQLNGQEFNFNITNVKTQAGEGEDEEEKKEQLNSQDLSPLKSQSVSKRLKQFLKDKPAQFWLAGVLLALMLIASIVLFFCLYKFNGGDPVGPPTFGHGDDLGDGIQVIHREEWLARDPLYTRKMADQPKIIRILHSTGANCSDYQTCANKVLGLQSVDVAVRGKPDIAYNFLIGGDGNVYIGRGEDVAIDERPGFLDIAYVGNYLAPYDKMTDKMNEAGKRLITRLLEKGKIARDYVVVPENQTRTTTSPGENVYKNIVKWPHYVNNSYVEL